ncbi:MAG TPA: flagellar protein FlgN [Burkholderiaceae bacterium]|jgi:flagella synthesis protein FlgN
MDTFGTNPAGSLSEENKAARSLLQLLQQEQDRLVAAKIDGLVELTEEKAKIVALMTELANSRHNALASAGFEPKETGMKAWLEKTASKTISKSWAELLSLVRHAKEMNRTNGLLINKHLARNQVALNVLRGAPQGGNFYGPDGQAKPYSSARGLAIG